SSLSRPHSLHLLLPRSLNDITLNWQSGEFYTNDSTFLLRWKVNEAESGKNASSPVLYHRVEYFLGFVDGATTFQYPTTLVWLPNMTHSWHTLAPIRAPQKSFALATEQNNLSGVLSDSLSRVFVSSMRLRFRVRSYGLMCVSEPSQELHIEEPLLGHLLPVLNRTVAREQLALQVMFEHPNNVSSSTTHAVEHFGSTNLTLGIPDRFWYTMSYSVLVCVMLCFILLFVYRVHRMGCMRKMINVTVAEMNQSPRENNRLLINQLRPDFHSLSVYHERLPEFTNVLTDLKQRANKPLAEVGSYSELKQSIFSHKAYAFRPGPNFPVGWNNLNSLQRQNASPSRATSDKPVSVNDRIDFASDCRNLSCIVVHANDSPMWTDSHTLDSGCTSTIVTDSSIVANVRRTHCLKPHAGMPTSQLHPLSEVQCLDLKSYPTPPSDAVHLVAYVPCGTNCLPLLNSTDPIISSVTTLPNEC
ncbi:hypothetical protein AHF37_09400, partial [Paragonimus kellicotti]